MTNHRRILYVASNNRHKIEEISAMAGPGWDVRAAQDAAPGISWNETGTTFEENARIKADVLRQHTKCCVLADDSGLQVAALNGAPGVWSSSYGGTEGDHASNNARLLSEMEHIPEQKRSAKFVCTLLFIDETGRERIFLGECRGTILKTPRGSQGFGYDPLFAVEGFPGKTMAELTLAEKNLISHRSMAMARWKDGCC